MTRRRWIADEVSGDRAALLGTHALHLVRVLRARIGQEYDISTGDVVRHGRIAAISADGSRVEFELGEEVATGAILNIDLLLAVFKFDRLEWAIEKCTELGVSSITPLVTRRTETHLASAAQKRVERWRRLAVQASEQSRRLATPVISDPVKLSEGLLSSVEGRRIVLAESEEQLSLKQALNSGEFAESPVTLAIGPEGGWTEDELALFSRECWTSASLGETILRAETAAIASVAVVMSELHWSQLTAR